MLLVRHASFGPSLRDEHKGHLEEVPHRPLYLMVQALLLHLVAVAEEPPAPPERRAGLSGTVHSRPPSLLPRHEPRLGAEVAMPKLDERAWGQPQLDRVSGHGGGLRCVFHRIPRFLAPASDRLCKPPPLPPFQPVGRLEPLLCGLPGWIRVLEHPNGGYSMEVQPSPLGFEVNGVLAAVGDDPAFDGGPVCRHPFAATIRSHNVAETVRAIVGVSRVVPHGRFANTQTPG